ncbi:MAG: bifunctional methylenetetrahydrofolate dehydrogenase/methenyltetrahydrofolate cyclohydrolase FolD [Alphaproteobacteria bacterium]
MTRIIDGKAVAATLREQAAAATARLRARHGVVPGLAVALVGDDPASQVYIRSKRRACGEAGIVSFEHRLPADCGLPALLELIAALNADDRVDGILVQLPLPAELDRSRAIAALDPEKDVDGFHPLNVGRLWSGDPYLVPCTPQGIMLLLRGVRPDVSGAEAVVLGRSHTVGRPTAALLLASDCTVTMVHSKTTDAAAICRRADILVVAIGQPLTIEADWVKPGAIVIDVGINRVAGEDGAMRLVGDVDFDAVRPIAGAITPVPGGVGPMTIACLLRNTVAAACRRRGLPDPGELEGW